MSKSTCQERGLECESPEFMLKTCLCLSVTSILEKTDRQIIRLVPCGDEDQDTRQQLPTDLHPKEVFWSKRHHYSSPWPKL